MGHSSSEDHICLIDGSGFIFRAFHALPPLSRSDGQPVNAVYGFMTMLFKVLQENHKTHVAVIFDAARKTFRQDIYKEYKAHRPPPPPELIPQFSFIRRATEAMGIPAIDMEGYEADDIIATYTRLAVARGAKVTIVSSDKDLMQLVTDRVTLFDSMKNKVIGIPEVKEKFGVGPDQVIEMQALIGDSSDNVPGAPGIGPKTALLLIEQYGSVENLLDHVHEIPQKGRRAALEDNKDLIRISKELVTLHKDVPLLHPLDDFKVREPNPELLMAFLREFEFKTMLHRVETQYGHKGTPAPELPSPKASKVVLLKSKADLLAVVPKIQTTRYMALSPLLTMVGPNQFDVLGFSFCFDDQTAYYMPCSPDHGQDLFSVNPFMTFGEVVPVLKPILEDSGIMKVCHDAKSVMRMMAAFGVSLKSFDDTMLLSYVLDGGKRVQTLDALALEHLGLELPVHKTAKEMKDFYTQNPENIYEDAAKNSGAVLRLHALFKHRLIDEHMVTVYETLDRALVPVLCRMEQRGICVDPAHLKKLSDEFRKRILDLEGKIFIEAGKEFNVGSPKQLGEILFDVLGLEAPKKSKTGAYSTHAEVLEPLAAQGHKIAEYVLEWRALSKLMNTYTDALPQSIDSRTGRVHTTYAQAVTSTGRLSSQDPNLQNIPIRGEEGRKIRGAFIAGEGLKLLTADYSQIELRLLAHMADVPSLVQAFKEGIDVHALTASQAFGVKLGEVTPELRRNAKAINFGIIYGISAFGLSRQIGCSPAEAKEYMQSYFNHYPGIKEYMDHQIDYARNHGYVTTLFGRKCAIPEIKSSNVGLRHFSERAAINAPLQGTSADLVKKAMIRIDQDLREAGYKAQMLLQVHDELIFELPPAEIDRVQQRVKRIMETVVALKVPLVAELQSGDHWAEFH